MLEKRELKRRRVIKELTYCGRIEGGAAINHVSTSCDDGVGSSIAEEHYVGLLLRHIHVFPVHTRFDPDHVSLATLLRSRSHRSRHRPEVPAAVRSHHHVRFDRTRLQKAAVGGGNPVGPHDFMGVLHGFPALVFDVVGHGHGHVVVSEVLCHGQCVAAQVLCVHLPCLEMLPQSLVGLVVREAVEASLLVGYGRTHESFEILGVVRQRLLGGVLFEFIYGLVELVEGLVNGFQAIVEGRFLPLGKALFA